MSVQELSWAPGRVTGQRRGWAAELPQCRRVAAGGSAGAAPAPAPKLGRVRGLPAPGEVKDTRPAFTPEDFLANIVTPAVVTRKGRFPVHFMGEEAHPRSCAHKKQWILAPSQRLEIGTQQPHWPQVSSPVRHVPEPRQMAEEQRAGPACIPRCGLGLCQERAQLGEHICGQGLQPRQGPDVCLPSFCGLACCGEGPGRGACLPGSTSLGERASLCLGSQLASDCCV